MADKFGKSLENKVTERTGLGLLLTNPRIQAPDTPTRNRIMAGLGVSGNFGSRSFDCVLSDEPIEQLTEATVDEYLPSIRLVEMKTTKKPIRSVALNGFFFGATAREFELAAALGDRFLFAFVVLNSANEYGKPFAVLLTLAQLEMRIKAKRVQFQVNLRSDTPEESEFRELVVFDHLPPPPLSL